MLLNRRCFCGAMAAAGASLLFPGECAAAPIPFCRFSIRDGWNDEPVEYVTHEAKANDRSGVPNVIARIKKAFAIDTKFTILIARNEDNAFATIANGRRVVCVDVDFLSKLNRITKTEWAAIQVIAHEVGHHIAGFSDNRHRAELNADYWSGQALQRLKSDRNAAKQAILTFGSEVDTPSHPNKYRRAEVIERGWTDAARDKIDYSFCDNCR